MCINELGCALQALKPICNFYTFVLICFVQSHYESYTQIKGENRYVFRSCPFPFSRQNQGKRRARCTEMVWNRKAQRLTSRTLVQTPEKPRNIQKSDLIPMVVGVLCAFVIASRVGTRFAFSHLTILITFAFSRWVSFSVGTCLPIPVSIVTRRYITFLSHVGYFFWATHL